MKHPETTLVLALLLSTPGFAGETVPRPRGAPPAMAAPAAAEALPASPDAFRRTPPHERPLSFDRAGDGALWVRGTTYKARFDAQGATYIPYLGAQAPRNFPVRFALAALSVDGASQSFSIAGRVEQAGERVTIAHGACDEVWDLARASAEQTFVFHERFVGALRLELDVETELEARARGAAFELTGEHGGVRYGEAWLADADGRKTALAMHFDDGRLVIEVPASALATARFPVAVDPVVTTIGLDTTDFDDFDPDVAFDYDTQRNVVVYEEVFSATDHDVYCEAFDPTGTGVAAGYLDQSTDDWRTPHVADLNGADEYLVVGSVFVAGDAHRHVRGRMLGAASFTPGSLIDIGSNLFHDVDSVDVGGDPYPWLPSSFCVVWRSGDRAQYQMVGSDGSLGFSLPMTLDWSTPGLIEFAEVLTVSISKSNREDRWTIAVGLNDYNSGLLPSGWKDIGAAQVAWDGSLVTPPWFVDIGPSDDTNPSASTPLDDGSVMIAFEREISSSDHDIYAHVIHGSTSLAQANLTTLDAAMPASANQARPSVDSDGHQFTVVLEEGSILTNAVLQSFWFAGDQIGLAEGRTLIGAALGPDRNPDLVGVRGSGGPARRFFVVFDQFRSTPPSGGNYDIYGVLYDGQLGGPVNAFCFGTVGTLPPCPCAAGGPGNGCPNSANPAGANLARLSGEASVHADTLVLGASGMTGTACIFIQGSAASMPVQVQDGLLCLGGSIVRLATRPVAAGASSYPQAGDPALSVRGAVPAAGGTRYYQTYYRNSVASFCPPGTGNYTNGMCVVWVP